MRVEEIAVRQEVRQMLNESGINKNTLKDIQEEVSKACKQAVNESDINGTIAKKINDSFAKNVRETVKNEIKGRIYNIFDRITVSVDITDKDGKSVVTRWYFLCPKGYKR